MSEEDDDGPATEQEMKELQEARERKKAFKLRQKQQREACDSCGKAVYATEKMQVDDLLLHKNCFRCSVCNQKLTLNTLAAVNGTLFCKKDFKEMFAASGGSYDVFGDAGFKMQTGRATNLEGVNIQQTAKANRPKGQVQESVVPVKLKPTPQIEKEEAPKSGGIKVELKKVTPQERKPVTKEAGLEKVELKKTPQQEKAEIEETQMETVKLKPTQQVKREIPGVNTTFEPVELKHAARPPPPITYKNVQPVVTEETGDILSLLSKIVYEDFVKINSSSIEEQKKFFLLRFVFTLELVGVKQVESLAKDFEKKCDSDGQFTRGTEFSMFLNELEKKYDTPFTSKKYRDTVFNSLDLDGNGKISFLEYLIFLFKNEIIDEHYQRKGLDPPKRVTFIGPRLGKLLITELFEPPAGIDSRLDDVYQEVMREKGERDAKMKNIRTKLKTAGKVKAVGLERELRKLEEEEAEGAQNILVSSGKRRVLKKQRLELKEIYQALGSV